MDVSDAPELGVGFAIDPTGSFDALAQIQRAMGTTEAKVIADAAKIEKATAGMVNVAGATAAIVAFGNANSREMQNVVRDRAQVERAGERMVAQLERQNATFGKSRSELRAMRAEEQALAAERVGNADLAQRLRAQEQALFDQEFAMTRRARQEADALAEEKEIAAQQAVAAAEKEAQALRSAALAHAQFEAAARRGMQTFRDQQAAESGAATEAERLAAAASRLKASIDPAYAAQQRFDQEMGRARELVAAGAVGLDDYCAKLRVEQALLTKSTAAHRQLGTAQRFTAAETLNLSRQFQDIGVTAAMGMNPLMILVQQGPQIYDVLEQARARGVGAGAALAQMGKDVMSYAVTGFSKLITFINPTTVLLAGTAVTVAAVVRALGSYDTAIRRFEVTAAGLGRVSGLTARQLEDVAEAASDAGQRSLSATRDSVAAFASAGIQGSETLTLLAANVEKYAKLTSQEVPAAQAALAEAMKDPARAADTFTQQLGLLTGAQYEHIRQLAAQGDQEKATAELTRILTNDLAANGTQATGLAHYMDLLGSAVAGVSTMFGKLDQRIKAAGASYDAWLKQHVGGWAVDLFGTGNKVAPTPNANAGRNQDQIAALNISQSLNTSGMKQINDLLAQQSVLQKGLANTTGLTSDQVKALRHDYAAVTDTINANRSASGAWITTQERAHLVAQAQAKLAASRTQTEKAAAQQQITRLQLGTQVLTQQERQTQAMDAYNKVADKYVKGKTDKHADTLKREAEATEAQIRNLYSLVDAYDASGAAALIAAARVTAESQAIKQRGDIEAAVDRQVRLSIAQRVADAAKASASTRDQARIQTEVNAAVANGLIPAERAADLLRTRIAELPLLQAIEAAQQRGLKDEAEKATKALQEQRDAQADANAARLGEWAAASDVAAARRIAELNQELSLIGATDAARTRALATLKATNEALAQGATPNTPFFDTYVANQVRIAELTAKLSRDQEAYNDKLSFTADRWDLIAQNVQNAARGMADAFGDAGKAIGDMAAIFAAFAANRARLDLQHQQNLKKWENDEKATARENAKYALASATTQIGLFGDMTAAAKGFFDEKSKGYKALATAEKVFRAIEFALSVKAMVQHAAETASAVANSAIRAAKYAIEAVAKAISSMPFPLNLVAGAATAAALASIGIAIGGMFGGGGGNNLEKANDGTGTVLGDSAAKSDSIKRSLDALKEVDTVMLSVSRQMASSLKSIDSQIGGFASVLVRNASTINASANVTEGFKANIIGSVLGAIPLIGGILKGLFGTTTTVIGNGLYGGAQSLGGILSGGFNAQYYSDIEKKSKFLGIVTSKKYSTQYSAADPTLTNQFTLILKQFNDAITAAAGPLGQSTAAIQNRLNSFVVSIGKIDLKNLTGEQIQEKLSAIFGQVADNMATAAFPGISKFQKVGEGAFETLVRVASTLETVNAALAQLGNGAVNLSIDAKMALADQFDSVSAFSDAVGSYFTSFYTKEEQAAAKTAQFADVFASLGVTMPSSIAAFRALVESQDLTTAAGQATYATLLKLAPAFADLQTSLLGAKSAADIASERQDLERQLLELQGNTAAVRALDLAKLDASNRALQEQIWAIQDAQAAAKAAQDLADAWKSVGDSIMDEVKRIRGLNGSSDASFATLMGQFNAANIAARGGDQDAAKSLPGLSQALLSAAANAATSRQELDRVQAQTAAQLEQTYKAITAFSVVAAATASSSTTSNSANLAAAASATSAAQTQAANDDLLTEAKAMRAELAQLRSDNNSGNAAIAGNTGAMKKTLDNVTSASGGDAISTRAA